MRTAPGSERSDGTTCSSVVEPADAEEEAVFAMVAVAPAVADAGDSAAVADGATVPCAAAVALSTTSTVMLPRSPGRKRRKRRPTRRTGTIVVAAIGPPEYDIVMAANVIRNPRRQSKG